MKNTPDSPDGAKNHQTEHQEQVGQQQQANQPPTHQQSPRSSPDSIQSSTNEHQPADATNSEAVGNPVTSAISSPQPNAVRVLFIGQQLTRQQQVAHGRRQLQQLQLQQPHRQQCPPSTHRQPQQQHQSPNDDHEQLDPCTCRLVDSAITEDPHTLASSTTPIRPYLTRPLSPLAEGSMIDMEQQIDQRGYHGSWALAMADANRRLMERQMNAYREADSQRWNFDFVNCRPLQNQGHRFEHLVEAPRNCRPLYDQSNRNMAYDTHRQGQLHQPPDRHSRSTDRGMNYKGQRGFRRGADHD